MSTRCFALVPCAGIGARAGGQGPKQYAMLAGHSVVARTLAALACVPRLQGVLSVVAPDDDGAFERAAPAYGGWVEACGGATRAASVCAGLDALRRRGVANDDWVLVHDAARCLVQPQSIERLIDACVDDEVGGLLALPLADTLKQADANGRVRTTIDRAGKWIAQTPQMFRLGMLAEALARAGDGVTDESSAIETLGLAPKLVLGEADNLKLTWPEDFERAARLLAARERESMR